MAAPRTEDMQAVLQRSQRHWQSDAHYAELHHGFIKQITNPNPFVRRVPAMPNSYSLEQISNGSLLEVRGRATWKYQPNKNCDLSEWIATIELTIGVTAPTKFAAVSPGFYNWEETSGGRGTRSSKTGNHLAILIPCWAYILSNFLVETQGCSMEFTNISAPSTNKSLDFGDPDYRVYVGNATPKRNVGGRPFWHLVKAGGQLFAPHRTQRTWHHGLWSIMVIRSS